MTMVKRRVSVTLDRQVAKRAADAARSQGASLSAWLNAAACRALFIEEGLAMAREWEEEHGPLTDEDRAWADAILNGEPGAVH